MSSTAPWLALSTDWFESEMFDLHGEQQATDGERLAWVCLLCHVKARGRGGSAKVRRPSFAKAYGLSIRAVDGMLRRAQKCNAVTIEGDTVTLCNWRTYQHKAAKAGGYEAGKKPETVQKCPTPHTSPSTHHPPQPPDGGIGGGGGGDAALAGLKPGQISARTRELVAFGFPDGDPRVPRIIAALNLEAIRKVASSVKADSGVRDPLAVFAHRALGESK